jgi:hypothetical protein
MESSLPQKHTALEARSVCGYLSPQQVTGSWSTSVYAFFMSQIHTLYTILVLYNTRTIFHPYQFTICTDTGQSTIFIFSALLSNTNSSCDGNIITQYKTN